MHAHAVARLARLHGGCRRIAHRAAFKVVGGRQPRGKRRIDPVDDGRARAEVPAEPLGGERDTANALALGLEEQRDVRLAERVDRLHRVADAEQAAPVARLPACDQDLEQARLRRRCVLVLVDQQVANTIVERECQLRRRLRVAKRVACGGGHGGMIEAVALGENRQQFRGRMRQHG